MSAPERAPDHSDHASVPARTPRQLLRSPAASPANRMREQPTSATLPKAA
jgi:hypothetical protein